MSNMNKNRELGEEDVKYKKPTQSNKSKSKKKSKHKHTYEACLIRFQSKNYFSKSDTKITSAKYCTICGKLSDKKCFEYERKDGAYETLTNEEVLEKYKGLTLFDIEDFCVEYVPIVRGEL